MKKVKKMINAFLKIFILKKKIIGIENRVITNKLYEYKPTEFTICKTSVDQDVL